jgi:putative membrane protein
MDGAPGPVEPPPTLRRRRFRPLRWFAGSLAALLAGVVGVDFVAFVEAQYARHWALGAGFTALAALALASAIAAAAREIRAVARLRGVDEARLRLQAALKHGETAPLRLLLDDVAAALPHGAASYARFRELAHIAHAPEPLLRLFGQEVLAPLDRCAYAAVGRAARDAGVLTAVVPTAALDTVAMLWRNLRMIREIAEIYGHRTGFAGTLFLVRRLLGGAAIVAASDVAGGLIAQQLGGALTEVVAAKLGEGAIAATRTARIGLLAMQLCRAVPFEAEDLPTLRRLLSNAVDRDEPTPPQTVR